MIALGLAGLVLALTFACVFLWWDFARIERQTARLIERAEWDDASDVPTVAAGEMREAYEDAMTITFTRAQVVAADRVAEVLSHAERPVVLEVVG